ncbi:MAG: (Fe-S)-binding protein [Gammaproteobacteria bacterium]
MQSDTPQPRLLTATDRCVMCGMCLPHCPTYQIARDEGESPRGRIALIQGLANGRLALTPRMEDHLEHCLGCRACEAMCPSGVAYGEIIDGGRALLHQLSKTEPRPRLLYSLVPRPRRLRLFGRILRLVQLSGLQALARGTGMTRVLSLGRLDALLPRLAPLPSWRAYSPPTGRQRGEVALFLGCFADFADRPTLNAAVRVLTRLGYGVHIPPRQSCCGALHLHQGDRHIAGHLAECNAAAFNGLQVDAIIHAASGCGATLTEYPRNDFPQLDAPIHDISTFLAANPWPEETGLAPLPKRVAIHDPCSLSHVLRQAGAPYQLLARIPGLEIVALPDNRRCCGAAGSYMLTQADVADRLRDDKIKALRTLDAQILATSNPGCALHLRAGIKAAGLNIAVMHPIEVLARQLDAAHAA